MSIDIPSAPANVEFLPSNSLDTLLISWSAPFSPLSVPLSYQLEISPDSGDPLDPMPTNSTSMLITLPQQSCSPIQIRAFAINAAGSGNSSATIDAFLLSCELCVQAMNNLLEVMNTLCHLISSDNLGGNISIHTA